MGSVSQGGRTSLTSPNVLVVLLMWTLISSLVPFCTAQSNQTEPPTQGVVQTRGHVNQQTTAATVQINSNNNADQHGTSNTNSAHNQGENNTTSQTDQIVNNNSGAPVSNSGDTIRVALETVIGTVETNQNIVAINPADEGGITLSASSTSLSNTHNPTETEEEGEEEVDLEDPESVLSSALSSLQNITSMEQLIGSGMIFIHGRPATGQDLETTYNSTSGKTVINNGRGELAEASGCASRMKTMRVNISNVDASYIVHPRCIQELRCSGCCRMPNVDCMPKYTERKMYNLLLLRPSLVRGTVRLESAGFHPILVERHLLCECKCTLTRETCGPKKLLILGQCRCQCRPEHRPRCQPPSMFDPNTCSCKCPSHIQCCAQGNRQCGRRLDDRTCSCVNNYISSYGNSITANNRTIVTGDLVTNVSYTTSTTTTASTTTTVGQGMSSGRTCRTTWCPENYRKVRRPGGTCICRPTRTQRNRRPTGRLRNRS